MTAGRAFRFVAVLIALAGAADPSWTRAAAVPQPVRISIIDRPTLDLPDTGGSRRAQAIASAARLRDRLEGDYTIDMRTVPDGRLAACRRLARACWWLMVRSRIRSLRARWWLAASALAPCCRRTCRSLRSSRR